MTFLVDVSHHDWRRAKGNINWGRVAESGIAATTVRMTYGDPNGYHNPSEHARTMALGANRTGMSVGGYHNLIHGTASSINRQVDWLRREMDAGSASYGMVDVERYPELLKLDLHPRIGDLRTWCDRWRVVEQRQLLVYLPGWVWGYMQNPSLKSLGFPLVSSNYGSNSAGSPSVLYAEVGGASGLGWRSYGGVAPTIWQFGSNAKVPGLSAKTDINAFRGSVDELRALLEGEDMASPEEIAAATAAALLNADMGYPAQPDLKFKNLLRNLHQQGKVGFPDWAQSQQGVQIVRLLGDIRQAIEGVDESVVAALSNPDMSAEQIAAALRAVLGDRAAEVGALLAAQA